jgi:hypothetical protein
MIALSFSMPSGYYEYNSLIKWIRNHWLKWLFELFSVKKVKQHNIKSRYWTDNCSAVYYWSRLFYDLDLTQIILILLFSCEKT